MKKLYEQPLCELVALKGLILQYVDDEGASTTITDDEAWEPAYGNGSPIWDDGSSSETIEFENKF